ncbi:MAG: DUF445 domain-containing protein [Alcaligenaceae bacterium]|nr:DUF445 domain-containing protein [Alcaligenaceae bacterium]
MSDQQRKEKQLRFHKNRATGLFILMAIIFIGCTILQDSTSPLWLGYIKAFSEAAMVGALADWYAVTALFHHPLGIKIPHTNIIRKKKTQIGDNLGEFIVDKFLSDENVRPYIERLQPSLFVGNWLAKESSQEVIVRESTVIILDTLQKIDDREIVAFIKQQSLEMANGLEAHKVAASTIDFVLDKRWHQEFITTISQEIRNYIVQNHKDIYNLVQEKSHKLIPEAVDKKIAKEITISLITFLLELENDPNHTVYREIPNRLWELKHQILTNEEWHKNLNSIKEDLLQDEKLERFAYDIWYTIKQSAITAIKADESVLKKQLRRHISKLANDLQHNDVLQSKLDPWIHKTAYRYFRKNRHHIAKFISSTVGNWEADRLNKTLELEVGKDLQYIRINGTLIGGLVGVIIHLIGSLL